MPKLTLQKSRNKESGLVRYCSTSTESTSTPNILSKASLGFLTDLDISALADFLEPICLLYLHMRLRWKRKKVQQYRTDISLITLILKYK